MIEFYGVVVMTGREYARLKAAEQALQPEETPPAPGVDTSGGIGQPTYKELYETEQRRANQAERELDSVMGQLDETRRVHGQAQAKTLALAAHIDELMACTSVKKAHDLHDRWLQLTWPSVSGSSDTTGTHQSPVLPELADQRTP